MRKTLCIFMSLCCVFSFSGCATLFQNLPQGWEAAAPDGIGQASILLRDVFAGKIEIEQEVKMCLASCGAVGGIDFWKSRNSNDKVEKRLLHAVKAADAHAEKYYPDLYNQYKGLPGIVAHALVKAMDNGKPIIELNESQLLLALLDTVVNNGMLGDLINFNTKDGANITL